MTTAELRDRLQRHYIKPGADLPGGVFLHEVGWNGLTAGGCDAIYVGFTSTSGRLLVGHELKVSRADWVKELSSPGKADGWADQCHQWWLVVSDPAIVREGELPEGWGLMVPGRSKTRMDVQVRPATKRDHVPGWLAVRSVIARQDTLRAQAIVQARQKAQANVDAQVREAVEKRVAKAQGLGPEAEVARKVVGAMRERGHWNGFGRLADDELEKFVDAACEVLDGRRLLRDLQTIIGGTLRGIEGSMADLRGSWHYQDLMKKLGEAKA